MYQWEIKCLNIVCRLIAIAIKYFLKQQEKLINKYIIQQEILYKH